MKRRNPHQRIDDINSHQDRIIASRLRRDRHVLEIARDNLRRWIRRDGRKPRPVFLEWQRIIERLTPNEIATFLTSDTAMARRLRQSSPFAGVLSEVELSAIRKAHAKN
ncbi:MAG: hypothetical protein ACXW32_09980 [Limisphaerales bacterium]